VIAPSALLLLLPFASAAFVLHVPGEVHDVIEAPAGGDVQMWISRTRAGARELVPVLAGRRQGPPIRVAPDVVAVDACAPFGLVLQDGAGIVDAKGKRLLSGRPLLSNADPRALFRADLCRGGELRMPVPEGLRVRAPDGGTALLPFDHRARAYSGSAHRGLRPRRPYGMALSLYAPRLIDADTNGDGRDDLVCVHESRVKVFLRGADGRLQPRGHERDFATVLHASDADLRMLVGDSDGDGRAELFVGITKGAVPERSAAYRVRSKRRPFDGEPEQLWSKAGFVAPLAATKHGLVVGQVDTSMVALGAALLTGEVQLNVSRGDGPDISLTALVDVRKGRMAGAMPIVTTDLDRDGRRDLVDVGLPGRAAVHPGTARGFLAEPTAEHKIGPFVHIVSLPARHTLALVGEPELGRGRPTDDFGFELRSSAPAAPRTRVTLLTGASGQEAQRRRR
jgi:hypothetical protein